MFPERLKLLREEKDLTKTYMGKLLGVSRQAYSKYEDDGAEPDIATINKLASFFEVTTDYLLGKTELRDGFADDEAELNEILEDPEFGLWYKELKGSPEENRKKALDFLRYLNEQDIKKK